MRSLICIVIGIITQIQLSSAAFAAGGTSAAESPGTKRFLISVTAAAIISVCTIILIIALKSGSRAKQSSLPDARSSENDITQIDINRRQSEILKSDKGECVVRLTDVNSPEYSFRCALGKGIIIGRDSELAMIAIDYDRYIARRHCRIWRENDKFYIENFSLNKVIINGDIVVDRSFDSQRLSPEDEKALMFPSVESSSSAKEVFDGDVLQIGRTLLRLEILK